MANSGGDIINVRDFMQKLPHKLDDSELANIARKIGEKRREISKLSAEKSQRNDHFKALIEGASAEADQLAETAATGVEERDVACIEQHVFPQGVARIVRRDTGEIVNERPLTSEERQEKFADWMKRQNKKNLGVDPTNTDGTIEGEIITDEKRMLPPPPAPETKETEVDDPQKLIDGMEPEKKPSTGRRKRKGSGRRRGSK